MRRALDDFERQRRRPAAASEYDARGGEWKFAGVHAELKAAADGAEYGRRFGGDPHRAALVLGIPVSFRPASALSAAENGRNVAGRFLPWCRAIEIADNMDPKETREVLAHEIAHAVGHAQTRAADRHADVFARAFLSQTPPPPLLAQAEAKRRWDERLRVRAVRARR